MFCGVLIPLLLAGSGGAALVTFLGRFAGCLVSLSLVVLAAAGIVAAVAAVELVSAALS